MNRIMDIENVVKQHSTLKLLNNIEDDHSYEENLNPIRLSTNNIDNNGIPLSIINDAANFILIEHCYARPHNWKPESNFLKPTKTLFIQHQNIKRKSINPLAVVQDNEDIIDVCSVQSESPTIYDDAKARYLMQECERHATFARVNDSDENWEDTISKINWTHTQIKLFNGMVHLLNNDHLARLAYEGVHNEPIFRRTVVDKSVKRVRHLFATILWDSKLTQWLHQLLIDHLSTPYLTAYLDILQTLKAKLPTFVDKMMYGPNSANRVGIMNNENLFNLLKRPWDPVASSLNLDKPKKLPNNPIIVVIAWGPYSSTSGQFKRFHKWINLFSNLASVQTINIGTSSSRMTMPNCVDQMLASTRGKIQEIKAQHPNRQIILAGFNAGSALALQVAQMESVLSVLCLGFSLHTAEGRRGDLDDNLLELQCPVLFVIGQCSNTSLQEEVEDLRERMRVETGLIIVGCADDYLRVNKKKKRAEGITQSVVDRCIVDEIGEFISGILLSPYPPYVRQPAGTPAELHKRSKVDRKRNNSNGSSLDSEPPSPTPRITRPGQNNTLSPILGRPPGSKSKNKLESKWAARGIITKSPSPTSPNSSSLTHSDITPNQSKIHPKTPAVLDFNKKISSRIFSTSNETNNKPTTNRPTSPVAKMQTANNRGLMQSSTLSSLLQGSRPVQQKANNPSNKVLENIALSTNSTAKLVSSTGRTIDLSKITILNSGNMVNTGSNYGNVILMPDRTKSGGVTRYITSKKQLLGNKPPKPVQKIWNKPTISSSNLLPPANLTSQDIMDLPIIFADDNQILTNSVIQPTSEPPKVIESPQQIKTSCGKLVFLNKAGTPIQTVKRLSPNQSISNKTNRNAVKYAKIILSKKINSDDKTSTINLSNESKKIDDFENLDLEEELVATAVPKPNFNKDLKSVTLLYKKPDTNIKLQTVLNDHLAKRAASQLELNDRPSKHIKLDN